METNCQGCSLCKLRRKVVFGKGPMPAKIACIGEAPGFSENRAGSPFVGLAGQRLTQLLKLAGIDRQACWIDNVVHCMPTDDGKKFRPPASSEIKACINYMWEGLNEVKPEIILALGAHALHAFLPSKTLDKSHGLAYRLEVPWGTALVVPLYHPSYYNRKPAARAMIAQDYHNVLEAIQHPVSKPDFPYQVLQPKSLNELNRFYDWLSSFDCLAMDFETTGLDPYLDKIIGISFSDGKGSWYVAFDQLPEYSNADVLRHLHDAVLSDPKRRIITYNGKYESKFIMAALGRYHEIEGLEDVSLKAYLLNRVIYKVTSGDELTVLPTNLKTCVLRDLGIEMTELKSLLGKGKNKKTMKDLRAADLGSYGAADSYYTYKLDEKLDPELYPQARKLYRLIDIPLIPALARMELRGLEIDWDEIDIIDKEIQQHLGELEAKIYELADCKFNIGSTEQKGEVLYSKLKLPPQKKTKKGFSTDKESLEAIQGKHEIVSLLLEHSMFSKLKSTYVDNIRSLRHPVTGRVHSEFKQTRTATSRLASGAGDEDESVSLNLQNMPKKTYWGKRIRKAVIAPSGARIMKADSGQEELRLIAHFSQDPAMLTVYREGRDIHTETATAAYSDREDFTENFKGYRDTAKILNFGGLSYLGKPDTIAPKIGLPIDETALILEKLFGKYVGLKPYQAQQLMYARKHGYVTTLWGRRLYIPEALIKDRKAQSEAAKKSINYQIQGSGGELIRYALITIDVYIKTHRMKSYIFNTVHDEVDLVYWEDELEELASVVRRAISPDVLSLPLETEIGLGDNWQELEDYEEI